jgi:nucleoside 2-deoxyribosyltransferase
MGSLGNFNMKIYIASRFKDREKLLPIRDKIFAMGHAVVSSWLGEVSKPTQMTRDEFWRKLAQKDFQEISSADILIRSVHQVSETGGASQEQGFAYGRHQNTLVWLVGNNGKPRCVFDTLADKHFSTWDECLAELKKYE